MLIKQTDRTTTTAYVAESSCEQESPLPHSTMLRNFVTVKQHTMIQYIVRGNIGQHLCNKRL